MSDRQIQSQKLFGFCLIALLVALGLYWQHSSVQTDIGSFLLAQFKRAIAQIKTEVVLNPVFYLFTAGILTLEWLFPAQRQQKLLSVGLFQDFFWLISTFFLKILLLRPYLDFLGWFHSEFLQSFSINLPAKFTLPEFITLVIAILLTDFLAWLAHFLQHKFQFLWRFHAIHHAQPELNLFTDARFHLGDAFTTYPLIVFPMLLLMIPFPFTGNYLLFRIWYSRLYHANIKSDFGWIKYILVTPQSHRIHHSLELHHYDRNFGVIFSFWDYLFRTQHRKYDEYPDTGIIDAQFPVEKKSRILDLWKTFWAQMVYPFLNFKY